MSSEMVERVAKAIFAELNANGFGSYVDGVDDLTYATLDGRFDLMTVARAAIAAMREPTEAMKTAAMSEHQVQELKFAGDFDGGRVRAALASGYRATIDEALKP